MTFTVFNWVDAPNPTASPSWTLTSVCLGARAFNPPERMRWNVLKVVYAPDPILSPHLTQTYTSPAYLVIGLLSTAFGLLNLYNMYGALFVPTDAFGPWMAPWWAAWAYGSWKIAGPYWRCKSAELRCGWTRNEVEAFVAPVVPKALTAEEAV